MIRYNLKYIHRGNVYLHGICEEAYIKDDGEVRMKAIEIFKDPRNYAKNWSCDRATLSENVHVINSERKHFIEVIVYDSEIQPEHFL